MAATNAAICRMVLRKNWPRGGERVAVAFMGLLADCGILGLPGGGGGLGNGEPLLAVV